jgi:hypothetical protein
VPSVPPSQDTWLMSNRKATPPLTLYCHENQALVTPVAIRLNHRIAVGREYFDSGSRTAIGQVRKFGAGTAPP